MNKNLCGEVESRKERTEKEKFCYLCGKKLNRYEIETFDQNCFECERWNRHNLKFNRDPLIG